LVPLVDLQQTRQSSDEITIIISFVAANAYKAICNAGPSSAKQWRKGYRKCGGEAPSPGGFLIMFKIMQV